MVEGDMFRVLAFVLIGAAFLALPTSAHSALSQYRGLTLGDSIMVVVERLQAAATDVKSVHEGSIVVQQLTWRPHRFISGTTVEPDALAEMVLTFHQGRLARIAVIYDRERMVGLTDEDVLVAMRGVYGAPLLVGTPTQPPDGPVAARRTIGRWEDADAVLVVWREQFPNRVGLTITSIAGDAALVEAVAEGLRRETADAPARESSRRAAEAAAIQARDEKIRLENRAKFKP
jgi:hypothetical protein